MLHGVTTTPGTRLVGRHDELQSLVERVDGAHLGAVVIGLVGEPGRREERAAGRCRRAGGFRVLVTGAGRGIGLEIARALVREGVEVAAGALNGSADLSALADESEMIVVLDDLTTAAAPRRSSTRPWRASVASTCW
jgi:hypothetical protein